MKKGFLPLVTAVAVLIVLLGIYMYSSGRDKGNSETEITSEDTSGNALVNTGEYTLCDKDAESLRDVVITRPEDSITIKYMETGYAVEGYEAIQLNISNAASMASIFVGLYSDNKIDEADLARYGLDNPQAVGTATYADGSSVTIKLGNATADNQYYYIQSSEVEGIYMVDAIVGARMLYTVNNLVDKSIATIKPAYVTYIEVLRNNVSELLLYYDEDNSNANTNLAQYGLATLTMERPLEGAYVYPYNLEGTLLSTCSSLTLGDVVDALPEDYAQYGLDVPRLTVRLADDEETLEIKAGNSAGDGKVYVMVDDSPSVFTMSENMLTPFDSYTITDFIEKFIALYPRSAVEEVSLDSEYGSFTLDFKEEGDNTLTTDENGAVTDNRLSIINGKQVEGDAFADFYELLVGLSFDQIGEHTPKSGEPATVLTYKLLDGDTHTIELYVYNDNFYTIGKDEQYDMLVSRQAVKQVVDLAASLSQAEEAEVDEG